MTHVDSMLPTRGRLPGTKGFPPSAYLEIMYGCNLRCNYCYIGELNNTRIRPGVAAWLPAMRRLRDLGVSEAIFLGGEPLLHPQLSDLCGMARDIGFSSRGVVTNGTLLSDRVVHILKSAGFWVDVTLRASTRKDWTAITGSPGHFDKVYEGLRRAAESDLRVGIEYDCGSFNYSDLFNTIAEGIRRGARPKHVLVHRILPMGEGARRHADMRTMPSQWETALSQATQVEAEFGVPVFVEDGLPFCLVSPERWRHLFPCACGNQIVTIDPEFKVRRCACDPGAIGSLFESKVSLKKKLQVATRRVLPEPCILCPAQAVCRGGCPASRENSNGVQPDEFASHFIPVSSTDWERFAPNSRRMINQEVLPTEL